MIAISMLLLGIRDLQVTDEHPTYLLFEERDDQQDNKVKYVV